jgi:hypothetical protein
MLVKCLYCDVENNATLTGGYCENCGKKLPPTATLRPRRTIAGIETAPDAPAPVPRYRAAVREALIVAAVVHLVLGGVFLIVGPWSYDQVPEQFGTLVLCWTILPTLVVGGLALFARYRPDVSTWLALALWAILVGVSFLLDYRLAARWLGIYLILLILLARAAWLAQRAQKSSSGA